LTWSGVLFGDKWRAIKDSVEDLKDVYYWNEVLTRKQAFCLFLNEVEFKYPLPEDEHEKIRMLQLRQILTGKNFGPKLELLLEVIPQEIIDFRLQNYKKIELTLTNSLSREKEVFRSIDSSKVKMYACGPTLYDSPHIGNGRSFVVFDVLYRLLCFE
jgi:hypothetical protein